MKRSALILTALLTYLLLVAPAALAGYGDAPAPAASASSQAQARGVLFVPPTVVDGNRVFYWRDARGNVVGLSQKGQLAWLEMPAGLSQVGAWDIHSGYALDYNITPPGGPMGPDTVIWDVYDSHSELEPGVPSFQKVSFVPNQPGGRNYPGRLIAAPLAVVSTVVTADGNFRLTNTWRWRPGRMALGLKQRWQNISADGNTATIFAPKLFIDVDTNMVATSTDSIFDNHMRSGRTLTAWRDPLDDLNSWAVTLRSASVPFEINAFQWNDYYNRYGTGGGYLTGNLGGAVVYADSDASFGVNLYHPGMGEGIPLAPGQSRVDRFSLAVK